MLLVVCPNLAIDRILEVDDFHATKVHRSRTVITQPGGKGSNVARVFRQLGGDVVLIGFVGRADRDRIVEPLQGLGIHVDAITAYPGESRTCTIICDPQSQTHPTVINEESPPVDSECALRLLAKIDRWIPRVDAVLTTGSLPHGLPPDFYAMILERARIRGKLGAIDAVGEVLRHGLFARPVFMKPNRDEFVQLTRASSTSALLPLAPHTALTLGRAGAVLIRGGECLYASPPCVFATNPIGAGDAFAAAYLKSLLDGRRAPDCFRLAMTVAVADAATLRPGFIDTSHLHSLASNVELRSLSN